MEVRRGKCLGAVRLCELRIVNLRKGRIRRDTGSVQHSTHVVQHARFLRMLGIADVACHGQRVLADKSAE